MEFKKPLTKLLIYVKTKALEAVDVITSAMQSNAGYDINKELGKGFFEFHRVYFSSLTWEGDHQCISTMHFEIDKKAFFN